jgi:hypothetical protein
MPDVIRLLHAADRCPSPPGASTPAARALLRRSLHPSPAAAPSRRSRPHVVAMRVAGGAAAAAVAVAVITSAGSSTPDARAAVVRAAQAMSSADSGVVVETSDATNDADGSVLSAFTQTMRFSGDDVDLSGTGRVRLESSGQLVTSPIATTRVAGGTLYVKVDGQPWRAATGSAQVSLADQTADAEKLPGLLTSPATRDAAQALATAMTDVTVSADGRGYDGQITTSALQSAYGSVDPLTVEEVTAHPANDLGPIAVHVDVDGAGVLSKVTFTVKSTWTHPTLPSVTMVHSIDYSGLGEPEQIDAPQVPAS